MTKAQAKYKYAIKSDIHGFSKTLSNSCNMLKNIVCCKLILLIIIPLLVPTASAQEKIHEIDKIFSWTTEDAPGCVCGVSRNGEMVFNKAYGSADLERNVPLSTGSVFDAGSVVKQFVAAATLILIEEGKLSLTDDIRTYIPELPEYDHTIVIDHLLTHTSGIRDWTGIKLLSSREEDALTMVFRQQDLNFKPGEEWSYSNSGYELLKEIIARVSGMPFGEFAQKHLFEPIGMKSTTYRHDLRGIIENRALAYEKIGDVWRLDMLFDNERGGGGALFSTASDLLIWNEALTNGNFGKFVTEKLHEPARLNNGRKLTYTRGLSSEISRGRKVVWHSGGAAGYQTVTARYPEHGLSIAITCNAGEVSQVGFAGRIADLFIPGNSNAGTDKNEGSEFTEISESELRNRVGLYIREEDGEQLRLISNGKILRVAGGPLLIPVDTNHFRAKEGSLFFMSEDAFEVKFLSNGQFELRSMEGTTTVFNRIEPFQPAMDELQDFDGQYESKEMNSILQVAPGEEGLVIGLGHSSENHGVFMQLDRDLFQMGRMTVRFLRDKEGNVVALDYSNPILQNIIFKRLNDSINQH